MMSRTYLSIAALLTLGLAQPSLAADIELKSTKVEYPTADAMFPGEGADAINNNCLACHSADHVMNQPLLSEEGWKEVVHKMVTAYKAPIAPEDEKLIVEYLVRVKSAH
jgi:cytochrome c5